MSYQVFGYAMQGLQRLTDPYITYILLKNKTKKLRLDKKLWTAYPAYTEPQGLLFYIKLNVMTHAPISLILSQWKQR